MPQASVCIEHRALSAWQARVFKARRNISRRAGEIAGRSAALLLFLLATPVLGAAIVSGARFQRRSRANWQGSANSEFLLTGRDGRPVRVLGALPRLLSVVRGKLAWVGPMEAKAAALDMRQESHRRIASALPGLVSPWWVRQRTNIAFGDEVSADFEFVETRSARQAAGVLVRAGLASLYGAPARQFQKVASILGLPIDNLPMEEAIDAALTPRPDGLPRQVSFINVDCVNKSIKDPEYREVLATSDLRLGDGIGLKIAGRLLGEEIRENVNGTDLFPRLCARLEDTRQSLFLLGGRQGVAEMVAEWAVARFPEIRVAGVRHGFFQESETPQVIEEINASGAAVLLVAFGAPKQEKWIRQNRDSLRVTAALGVGGLFDFYSGRIPRAPQWLRELGLEWVYRLYQEPGRMWRRYLVGNVVFLSRVIWQRLVQGHAGDSPVLKESLQ